MAWTASSVLVCVPDTSGSTPSPVCPAGQTHTTQSVFLPDSNPQLVPADAMDFAYLSLSIVLMTWILTYGLGRLIRLVQQD